MAAVLAATPEQPAYRQHRLLVDLVRAAADGDANAGRDWQPAATRVTAAVAALTTDHDGDTGRAVAASATAAAHVQRVLAVIDNPSGSDPADIARAHANATAAAGDALAAASPHATDTGHYLRALAAACHVAAHLLRADASALDADRDGAAAHTEAADRRANLILNNLAARFAPEDPLAAPLRAHLAAEATISPGAPAAPVLADWATMAIPAAGRHRHPPSAQGARRRPGSR
jgi:hypothetical protein